jgi:hypothetical protein
MCVYVCVYVCVSAFSRCIHHCHRMGMFFPRCVRMGDWIDRRCACRVQAVDSRRIFGQIPIRALRFSLFYSNPSLSRDATGSDCHDQQRTLVLQTFFVMNLSSFPRAPRTRMLTNVCHARPRTIGTTGSGIPIRVRVALERGLHRCIRHTTQQHQRKHQQPRRQQQQPHTAPVPCRCR